MRPRIRLPHVLTTTGLAGFLLLFSFNVRNLFDHPDDWSAVRSDMRVAFLALFLVGVGWFGIWYALDTVKGWLQHFQRINSSNVRFSHGPDEHTHDLGVHLRVVGTAAVAASPVPSAVELTEYDKGYVDCLVDNPLGARAQVIPIHRGRPS